MKIAACFRILSILMIFSLLAGLTACNTTTPTPMPQSTDTPAPATATLLATSTPTLAPTATATATPKPTFTPTTPPTRTPQGFYTLNNSGFSLIYPTNWKIASETGKTVLFQDKNGGLGMYVDSFVDAEAATAASTIAMLQNGDKTNTFKVITQPSKIEIGSGIPAEQADLLVSSSQGPLYLRLIVASEGKRSYVFQIISGKNDFDSRKPTLDKVLASINFFKPQPYGLRSDETIVQLGADPLAIDLDPAISSAPAADYIGLLFGSLVRLTPELKVIPGLAEKWNVSDDGKVYTFTLYEDLKFANGTPITAKSVQESWERTTDPKMKSTNASTYLGDILGVKEKLAGKADTIAGLKVIDNRTLEVTLDGAKPYFLAKIHYPTAAVMDVNDAELAPKDWMFSPNASGPYKVKEYIKDEAIIFERNANYPVQANVPYLVFLFEPGGKPLSLYEEGTIDMLYIGMEDYKRVSQTDDPLHDELRSVTMMCTGFILINPDRPPLDDINVRKALLMAIDRNEYIEKMTGNFGLPANEILPPAMPGYLEREPVKYDPAAAKAALAASKYGANLPPIKLVTAGYAGNTSEEISWLSDMWQKNLGIKITVELVDPTDSIKSMRNSTGNIMPFGWCADYPDPENFLDVLFHSSSDLNLAKLNNPALDSILEEARTETDPDARIKLYQQAESLLLDDVDAIPLSHGIRAVLSKPGIKGIVVAPIHTEILAWLSLEPEK